MNDNFHITSFYQYLFIVSRHQK